MVITKLCVVLEKTKEPAFGVNAEGRICDWNEGAEDMFGYSRSEAMNQSCAALLNCERDGPQGCELLCSARENRMVQNRDRRMSDKCGRDILVQISNLIYSHLDYKQFVMVHICRDISREKQTEACLSQIAHLGAQLEPLSGGARPPTPDLTQAEILALRLTAGGNSPLAIAAQLRTSAARVRRNISSACRKLGVQTRREAVLRAARLGQI